VAAGARRDLGELDAAVVTLQTNDLNTENDSWAIRLRYAYADALFRRWPLSTRQESGLKNVPSLISTRALMLQKL
jgi:hypothetical protein